MPLPANQQIVVQIRMQGLVTAGGSSAKNADWLFYYSRTNTANAINKANVEAAFQAGPALTILGGLNARYSQAFNAVRCLNDALDPYLQVPRAIAGSIAGDSMTTVNAVYLLFRTTLRGKSYRGAKHFFPLSESDSTSGGDDLLNAAAITRWNAIGAALLATFTDGGGVVWTPCIVSRKLSQVRSNPTTVVYNPLFQVLLNKRIGRMSKREVASVY